MEGTQIILTNTVLVFPATMTFQSRLTSGPTSLAALLACDFGENSGTFCMLNNEGYKKWLLDARKSYAGSDFPSAGFGGHGYYAHATMGVHSRRKTW
jgi:hypothetical protein